MVICKSYQMPNFNTTEILRYAGCKKETFETTVLLNNCISELSDKISNKVCYTELSVQVTNDVCDFQVITTKSAGLSKNLKNCKKVILFAATIGIEIDRLISKYGRISPSKALMFQAIGSERIETLCEIFCKEISDRYKTDLTPRFSPGYGDLSLSVQEEIFEILKCSKNIGLTLNDSLLMSPTKSVTAFVGIID